MFIFDGDLISNKTLLFDTSLCISIDGNSFICDFVYNQSLIVILRDRLYHSLGQPPVNAKPPPRPFKVVDVQPERPRQPAQPAHPVQSRSRTSSANYTVVFHISEIHHRCYNFCGMRSYGMRSCGNS